MKGKSALNLLELFMFQVVEGEMGEIWEIKPTKKLSTVKFMRNYLNIQEAIP